MKTTVHASVWLVLLCLHLSLIGYSQTQKHHIHFDVNQNTLSVEQKQLLQEKLKQLNYHPSTYTVEIIGHTDNIGSLAFNQKLSLERSKAAQQYLQTQGFDSTQFQIKAEAYKKPIAANQTDNGRAQNRRVELIFSYQTIEIPNQVWHFDAAAGGKFKYDRSLTQIYIPQDALIYADGSTVKGEVELYYKEFRDIPDFVFSGIPMDFKGMPFNSAGMFEIRAFQDGKELFVAPEKGFEVDFVLTDTLPLLSFYEFNDKQRQWRAVEALNRQTQKNNLKGKLAANPFNENIVDGILLDNAGQNMAEEVDNRCPADLGLQHFFQNQDTLGTIQKSLEFGIRLMELKNLQLPVYYKNYYPSFHELWNRADYVGTHFVGNQPNIPQKLFHINIKKKKKLSRKRLEVSIKDLTGENTELAALDNQRWYIRHYNRRKRKNLPIALQKSWADVKLKYSGQCLKLTLLGASYDQNLSIYPILKRKNRKKQREILQEIAKEFDQERIARAQKFNQVYADSNLLFKYFLATDQLLKTDEERCKSYNDWCAHISNNKDSMKTRYQQALAFTQQKDAMDSLRKLLVHTPFQHIPENRAEANLDPIGRGVNNRNRQFVPIPYYVDPSFENETEAQRARRVAKEKKRLKNLANMVQQWQGRSNLDAGHTFPPLVQKLTLDGFGIFNNDQIRILGNSKQILAAYKDQKGNRIEGKVLSMIDYTINGAMSFPPNNIALNPKAKNALLLFATNGKKYILRAEALKKQLDLDKSSHTFIMEDITNTVKTAQALKKELGLDL